MTTHATQADVDVLKADLDEILSSEPKSVSYCRSCGAEIWWGETKAGKRCPYDVADGKPIEVSHFATCPDAKRWSRR